MRNNVFKITPVQDKSRQNEICKLCGVEYRQGFLAYQMVDTVTGELMGMSQFEIGRGSGYISDLRAAPGVDDFEAMFILGRQTMNFIDLCGLHECRAAKYAADEQLLRAIGFKEISDGLPYCNMTGMFDGHCDGHAVKL